MANEPNKITVKATGPFELRDPISDVDIGEDAKEVIETSFVSQMIGLGRLKVTGGKVTQESPSTNMAEPPAALPTRDAEPTIKELTDKAKAGRGRPPLNR